jgi:hypothetical protein
MLAILAENIHDNRFLRLIRQMLQAGYLEDWEWNATLSGCPQGGVVSPVLSNIYLDRLDKFVETALIPEYTRGVFRKDNPEYGRVRMAAARAHRRGDRQTASALRKRLRGLPSGDPRDPGFRRLHYTRYADDHLLGFTGPRAEAEQIKDRLAAFLRDDLKLELSPEKTLITHARTGAARFPGYEITTQHSRCRRKVNGVISLRVPRQVIKAKCAPYFKLGKPERRTELINCDDLTIISTYGSEYRGLVQYYLLAGDVWRLTRLRWAAETSMLKTLAAKHESSVTKMARKYKATIATPHGPRTCFQATVERAGKKPLVARFGGIPLKRQKKAVIDDRLPAPPASRKELVTRLRAGWCELCEQRGQVEVRQIRRLADLAREPAATAGMGAAHGTSQAQDPRGLPGLPSAHPHTASRRDPHAIVTGEPDDRKRSRPVRAGGRRKRTRPAGTSPAAYRYPRGSTGTGTASPTPPSAACAPRPDAPRTTGP